MPSVTKTDFLSCDFLHFMIGYSQVVVTDFFCGNTNSFRSQFPPQGTVYQTKFEYETEEYTMTEKEKMLAGKLYDPSDPELGSLLLKARKLARKYNTLDEDQPERQAILTDLLCNSPNIPSLQAPIYFDYGCNTSFGKFCSANFNFTCLDVCPVHIGDSVMIGPNVTIATPMHPLLPEERNIRIREDGTPYNLEYAKPITIEKNCWLASNVVVCGGVTIGEGCVIGAGSVVTRSIPPHSLAAGNPCRVIRTLTEQDRME